MEKRLIVLCLGFALLLLFPAFDAVAGVDAHKDLACTACHATRPVQGQPVDVATGSGAAACAKCHEQQHSASSVMATTDMLVAASVKSHSSTAPIPEAMKQQMIQWLASHNYAPYGDPASPWTLSCNSCHAMHGGSPYPALLKYNMENGGLCTFCHGGIMNIAGDWGQATARRVIFGPSHLGLRQPDGTEVPAPVSPKDNDVVNGIVNFPLAVLTGNHRTTADIAYRISIPGSVFNLRDVNPANHMYWAYDADMVTWDTTLELNNKPFTVTITPYDPVTLAEGNPIVFYVIVRN